ncbi:MAG: alpha/beta hydrolase [Minwuiales bacterium]|nr:alpha/beta hydrolase [Minwuiales bacterium]
MSLIDGYLTAAGHRLEAVWYGPPPDVAPTLVFLHEGLGCVSMWRDFPEKLAAATGCGALVYSRLGYGRSEQRPLPWPVTYMHDEGLRVLPDVLSAARVQDCILVGHSDGGSVALIYAGGTPSPSLRGVITEAAHVFLEDESVESVGAAKQQYLHDGLKQRLARHHGENTDCAFFGWADSWLNPAFRDWNIEEYLAPISAPVLAIQGVDDRYGTQAQVDAVVGQVGGAAEALMLPDCGHSPHREQEAATLTAMTRFIGRILTSDG